MDQHGLEACGIGNTVRDLRSCISPDMGGKTKNLSVFREKFTGTSTEFEGDNAKICPNLENTGYKDELFQKVEGEHSSYGKTSSPRQNVTSGDCTEGDASSWKPQQSSVSSSSGLHDQAGMYRKDSNCSEGTSVTTSSRNGFVSTGMKETAGDRSPKDGAAYKYSSERIVSSQQICVKSEVGSDTGKSFNPEQNEELDVGTTKSNQVNAGEYGLKSMMQVSFDGKLLKTETPSSKSKPVICPVSSSSDSCQKTSLETKSYNGNKKDSGTNESVCIGFRCSLEESPSKSIALGMAMQHESLDYWKKIMEQKPDKQIDSYIAPKVVLDPSAMLRGKQGNMGKTSEAVETFRGSDTANMLVMIAEKSSMTLEKIDVSKSRRLKPKNAELLSKDKKEMEITNELDDALEVARRVAREVEQEVGIYKEASGSSSSIEENYSQTVYLSTVDSTEPKKKDCLAGSGDRIQSCSERENPDSCCSTKEETEPEISAGNEQLILEVNEESREISPTRMPEADDDLHEQESSQLTTIPDDVAANDHTRYCGFDLNEDIQAEEMEYPGQPVTETVFSCHVVNVSTPIPVVATSRVPVCLPMPPLKFEGELGWRGSAVTSAFRPASLCKTAYKKAFSIDENNCSERHSQGFQGIDLNVADAGDNLVMELSPEKHISESSGLPSGESSVEVSSRRVERLNLDLNLPGDNDDNCLHLLTDWRMEHKLHIRTNGARSPPTSLSRPSIGDFDLNDNPSFEDAHSEAHRPGQGTRSLRNTLSDDPVVSFAGTTIQLDSSYVQGFCHGHGHGRMEFLPPAQPFLMAAPNVGPSGRVVPLQATLTCTPPPPSFPYNTGFGVGPTVPFPPTIYPSGVVPYMIDTRGYTTIPQILGSGTLPSFPRAPHLMEFAGGPRPSDIAILRPSLDLNVGIPSMENQSRGGTARQLGIPTSNSLVEEQMKSFSQGALSGTSMKRKEPECGWDSYQVGYRHATSWR